MFSALTDATDRLDPKWLVAFWLPALVATTAGVGILALLVGPPLLDAWVNDLDGVDQIVFGVLLLGVTSLLALFFKAMRRPVFHLFAGDVLPHAVADWAIRRRQRAREHADDVARTVGGGGTDVSLRKWRSMIDRAVPLRPTNERPTRFGTVMANLEDHTYLVHGIDYRFWWPRLAPLLPDAMRNTAANETSNMTGLLNLSLVWATMGPLGAAVLGPLGSRWGTAAAVLLGGFLLSWISYRAAVREGAEAGRHLHAAFDLYRHEVLKQMALDIPGDAEGERALWQRLTAETVARIVPTDGAPVPPSTPTPTPPSTPTPTPTPTPKRRTRRPRARRPADAADG